MMPDLDPHVDAVAKELHDTTCGICLPDEPCGAPRRGDADFFAAHIILTSTDPAVHAALLAALVRAGVLDIEASGGPIEPEGKRRYVTDWENIDE